MTQKRLWLAAGIIALVIGVGFAISVPHTTRDTVQKSASQNATTTPIVLLKDSYKKGIHTLSGSVTAPDACNTLATDAQLVGDASSTQSISVTLTLSSAPGVCLELPTVLKFSTTVTAPSGLPVTARVNGVAASTTAS
ncbi:MAG: hypothetical protein JWN18_612 [Parcubacteria group bacterium]|nr:hypothetical protein [Parcubacteria group bacterium]